MTGVCVRCHRETEVASTEFGDLCLDCLDVVAIGLSKYVVGWYNALYSRLRDSLFDYSRRWKEIVDEFGGLEFTKELLHTISLSDSNPGIRDAARSIKNYVLLGDV